jgi:hypothetical protein
MFTHPAKIRRMLRAGYTGGLRHDATFPRDARPAVVLPLYRGVEASPVPLSPDEVSS